MDGEESKFIKKMKDNPFVPIGLVGLTSVVIYGIYNYKNRKNMKTSIYLIHLRLAAQGTLLGTLTIGLLYTLVNENYSKFFNEKK